MQVVKHELFLLLVMVHGGIYVVVVGGIWFYVNVVAGNLQESPPKAGFLAPAH